MKFPFDCDRFTIVLKKNTLAKAFSFYQCRSYSGLALSRCCKSYSEPAAPFENDIGSDADQPDQAGNG